MLWFNVPTGLSCKSAEVVTVTAFEALRFKDVARSQMASGVKNLCSALVRRELKDADKTALTIPLAAALAAKNIIKVEAGTDLNNLKRGDVSKVGTF